jgi:diguanylate cyclase (GGDEF)-like protein
MDALIDTAVLGSSQTQLACLIAVLAAFVTMELLDRVRRTRRKLAGAWLAGAAFALGTGMWSAHVIGLSAQSLPFEMSVRPMGAFGAWVSAVIVALAGLGWSVARVVRPPMLIAGSAVLAFGIVAVQATALLTLGLRPVIDWPLWSLGAAFLVVWAGGAIAVGSCPLRLRIGLAKRFTRHALAGVVLGVSLVLSQHLLDLAAGLSLRTLPAETGRIAVTALTLLASAGSVALLGLLLLSLLDEHMQASLRLAESELQKHSLRDGLTRLPNRLMFEGTLAQAVKRADTESGKLALLFVGLDGFKHVNQSYGHSGGDHLLRVMTKRLRALAMPHMVARVGGDEFVMLLTDDPTEANASTLAAHLQQAVSRPVKFESQEATVACSIGIALYPEHGAMSTLISHADAAMREVKGNGGAGHCFFEPRMVSGPRDQAALLRDLRRAMARQQFELFYQPKIDAPSGEVTGAEALIRWHHPRRGMVGPAVFIPLAERYGLIGALGQWVIEEACRQARVWRDDGLRMRVAINLSPHQLRDPDLAGHIAAALKKHEINPKLLTCEITESVAMQDSGSTWKSFAALAAIGVHISIDDFGTGYSSLSYLRKLPAEEIKIDRSFVLDLETSADARAVVDAVIKLGHALNLKVVAEGVENEAQNQILRSMGCNELQGYLFAKPMAASALGQWAINDVGPRALDFRSSLFQPSTVVTLH